VTPARIALLVAAVVALFLLAALALWAAGGDDGAADPRPGLEHVGKN
jgi:hypothetical protein